MVPDPSGPVCYTAPKVRRSRSLASPHRTPPPTSPPPPPPPPPQPDPLRGGQSHEACCTELCLCDPSQINQLWGSTSWSLLGGAARNYGKFCIAMEGGVTMEHIYCRPQDDCNLLSKKSTFKDIKVSTKLYMLGCDNPGSYTYCIMFSHHSDN